ncbi:MULTISPECIES: arginase family protein [Paenibacillus]|uniref:Arginase family protein n=1 Tax=Paenibacillus polymyxa TaxID=1406 RepID=A0A1D7MPX8_PAEPO|nr:MULTISPECIES: arginase family protein [Paenibacillus]AOK92781.1 arginase [Paenibacillus polymyxa]KYG93942.1 arginase [Paenibacillus polymyxa]MCP3810479.1 arginase family protein [Paenibacillus sp. Lou8.1]URJ51948.1 arginase family protein [Paenibacillus polymyxa]
MTEKTIRLLMPQWQGGNNPNYSFGAELLAWLAPDNDQPLIHVPIQAYNGTPLENENGMNGRKQLLEQLEAAQHIIDAHKPDRIVMFGGDCLVEQAPFAYLNERYGGELGLIWIDAHSDLVRYVGYDNGHTLPLGNLLGEGDEEFAKHVKIPLKPENVFIAGLAAPTEQETEAISEAFQRLGIAPAESDTEVIQRLGIKTAGTKELTNSTESIREWIKESGIKHLAIHLDLDVLDPKAFRSLLFANPEAPYNFSPAGTMQMPQLLNLIKELSEETDVVGLGITEHMPWDAINLKNLLGEIPILNK